MGSAGDSSSIRCRVADDAVEFLRGVRLLAGCTDAVLREVAAVSETVLVPAGSYLFRQGDQADGMTIVRAGRLAISIESPDGQTSAARAGRGATLGELALLTNTTRSASVRAVRDSEVVTVSRGLFEGLLEREPSVAVAVARNLAQRLAVSVDLTPSVPTLSVFAVVPLTRDRSVARITDQLVAALRPWGTVATITKPPGADAEAEYAAVLDRHEASHTFTILTVGQGSADEAWSRFCIRSADRVIALLNGDRDLSSPAVRDRAVMGCDVAFIGEAPSASTLRSCLDTLRPRAHHFVGTKDGSADVGRLARRLTGRSVGLVLSGGGARGFAHIGVIERLREAGIEIDAVGGTSMGAFVAAMFGLGWDPTSMLTTCREEFVEHHPFNDYTVPRFSLIRARKAAAMLSRTFGDASLEQLRRSTFVVTSDLGTGDQVVHTRGLVRETVGASMSIPGLVPPVAYEGRLLVDGGLLNNLPVDVMAARREGPVLGVDVMRQGAGSPRRSRYKRTPSTSLPLLETLARATFLGSRQRAATNRDLADMLIAPAVESIGLLQFDRIDEAFAAGYDAAETALADGLEQSLGLSTHA
jgi:NTE family protein